MARYIDHGKQLPTYKLRWYSQCQNAMEKAM